MSTLISKIVQKNLDFSNKIAGENYTYKGRLIKGITEFSLSQKDLLRFEVGTLPGSVAKIEIKASEFETPPRIGDYLTQEDSVFEVFSVDYKGSPIFTYVLFCAGRKI